MTIKYPCPNPNFLLKTNPFTSVTYNLRDPEISKPYTINDLVYSDNMSDCDTQSVSFFYDDVSQTPFDTSLFTDTGSSFKINYTENVLAAGKYYLTYKVKYNSYPLYNVQAVPFVITIVDPCDNPVGVTPSTLSAQEYTITQTSFTYQVPVFVSNPTWCAITYSYTISNEAGDSALSFDTTTRIFTFSQVDDLSLSGSTSKDYVVTVTGQAGISTPVQG